MNDPNIVKFYPKNAASDPDNVLEQAMGAYSHVLILGWRKDDGSLDGRASLNLKDGGDVLWILETFKFRLLAGDYSGEPDE
jgi:hypothetical protein